MGRKEIAQWAWEIRRVHRCLFGPQTKPVNVGPMSRKEIKRLLALDRRFYRGTDKVRNIWPAHQRLCWQLLKLHTKV